MFDWIATNWVWLLLGLGVLWLFLSGRMGCGAMGRRGTGCHGEHAGSDAQPGAAPQTGQPQAGPDRNTDAAVSGRRGRRHRGC